MIKTTTTKPGWDPDRVSETDPCEICNSTKWCGTEEGVVFCPRREMCDDSRCSCHRKSWRFGSWGWVHQKYTGDRRRRRSRTQRMQCRVTNFEAMRETHEHCVREIQAGQVEYWAERLGVSQKSLRQLEFGYHNLDYPRGVCFPVRNVDGHVVGISVRRDGDDQKRMVIGSSTRGVFTPVELDPSRALFMCEGATDTAALLTMGVQAIGRISTSDSPFIPVRFALKYGFTHVVAVADRDDHGAGQQAAEHIARCAKSSGLKTLLLVPPFGSNDVRQWLGQGACINGVRKLTEQF